MKMVFPTRVGVSESKLEFPVLTKSSPRGGSGNLVEEELDAGSDIPKTGRSLT